MSNVQYPSAQPSPFYIISNNTQYYHHGCKGSLKWSRSIGGDAQQPSASKKKRSPGMDTGDTDAAPSNTTTGVTVNLTIDNNVINGRSTVNNTAPSNATGSNTANPTVNDDTGRGATSSNGTADVVCNTLTATTGVDGNNKETSNAAIDMAASSPTAKFSTNTLVDHTVTAASNNNDNNVAAVVQVASQMVSILCTIIRWKMILNLNYFIFNKYSHTNLIVSSPCMTLALVSS